MAEGPLDSAYLRPLLKTLGIYIQEGEEKERDAYSFRGSLAAFRRRANPVLERERCWFSKCMILASLVTGDSTKSEIEVLVMVMHFVFPSPMILKIVCIV